jgi:hypothetical protein
MMTIKTIQLREGPLYWFEYAAASSYLPPQGSQSREGIHSHISRPNPNNEIQYLERIQGANFNLRRRPKHRPSNTWPRVRRERGRLRPIHVSEVNAGCRYDGIILKRKSVCGSKYTHIVPPDPLYNAESYFIIHVHVKSWADSRRRYTRGCLYAMCQVEN